MQSTLTARQSTAVAESGVASVSTAPMDPLALASLDFGLFRTLHSMGTSRERICFTMCLDETQYDYLAGLL